MALEGLSKNELPAKESKEIGGFEVLRKEILQETVELLKENPTSNYEEEVVKTSKFQEWFKGSQIVIQETNEPLVLFHQTKNRFGSFEKSKIGSQTDHGYYGKGFYLSNNPGFGAYADGENFFYKVYVNIKNPFYYEDEMGASVVDYSLLLGHENTNLAKEKIERNIKDTERQLAELQNGEIYKHNDIPQDVDFEEYWKEKEKTSINNYIKYIQESKKGLEDLKDIFQDLQKYDGVIKCSKKELALENGIYQEIVVFEPEQALILPESVMYNDEGFYHDRKDT